MEDIICTVPWSCGVVDGCVSGWHLANYWIYSDGTYSIDKYSDGDHDHCEQDEVPTAEQECEAWKEYHEYVAETGKDPLSEFAIPQHKVTRQWQARIRNSIGSRENGLRVTGVRRRGRGPWFLPDGTRTIYDPASDTVESCAMHVPVEVCDYLFSGHPAYVYGSRDPKPCHYSIGPDLNSIDALKEACGDALKLRRHELLLTFTVDESPKPWSDERVQAYLRKVARKALRETM